jgi:hypothetical protein
MSHQGMNLVCKCRGEGGQGGGGKEHEQARGSRHHK